MQTKERYTETEISFCDDFFALTVREVAILTTFGAGSDENFIKMTLPFECMLAGGCRLGPLLLTWINFNASMDK